MNIIRQIRQKTSHCLQIQRLFHQWKELRKDATLLLKQRRRLLLIACDPWSIFGSRGDDAMISVAAQHFPANEIYVITASDAAAKAVEKRGWTALNVWSGREPLRNIIHAAEEIQPEQCVVLGADVMDGYYAPEVSLILLASADLLRERKIATTLLGFSFNATPSTSVLRGIRYVTNNFRFNLRDPISLERFEHLTGRRACLTADTAFLLQPETGFPEYEELLKWKQKSQKPILAFNYHPMLLRNLSEETIDKQINRLGGMLEKILDANTWNILLIAHDFRERVGDNRCLGPLHEFLSLRFPERVFHMKAELSAAELKGVVKEVDALITARMHLGIAALSQGIPTAGFAYQGKFNGLLAHFRLPDSYLFEVPSENNIEVIRRRIEEFLEQIPELKTKIRRCLPEVLQLAERNFDFQ